ncbi:MAG: hypothetical protein ACON4Z_12785, partial [Planctomycetota bacterium]
SDAPTERPSTRRAFLLAGGAFVAGVSLGSGGSGVSSDGASPADVSPADDRAPAPATASGRGRDQERDLLRRLVTHGAVDALIDARFRLLHFVASDARHDEVLWSGVARLGRACLNHPSFPDRLVAAQWIARRLDEAPRATAAHRALTLRLQRLR